SASITGRQSATSTAHTTPGVAVTTASATGGAAPGGKGVHASSTVTP
ncbi:MAG: hypothetical protein RL669_2130, partial [Pseudomonadota bacterium]